MHPLTYWRHFARCKTPETGGGLQLLQHFSEIHRIVAEIGSAAFCRQDSAIPSKLHNCKSAFSRFCNYSVLRWYVEATKKRLALTQLQCRFERYFPASTSVFPTTLEKQRPREAAKTHFLQIIVHGTTVFWYTLCLYVKERKSC